ncbi:hypothetical protein PLICRDRAFT_53349 [Plicaturopsis crispa FD-325 SS-3]|nr:hypothetical protein PLICRDRAFT_53349 [Plicaturopsis crispa FD-325 SS-3]
MPSALSPVPVLIPVPFAVARGSIVVFAVAGSLIPVERRTREMGHCGPRGPGKWDFQRIAPQRRCGTALNRRGI